MVHAVPDPLLARGKAQRAPGRTSLAERAGHRNEPVADEARAEARRLPRERGGDSEALHARGQGRHLPLRRGAIGGGEAVLARPVLVEKAAVAKVGDAGAAQLAEARERGRVRARVEHHVHPVAAALERRAIVRRAEEDDLAHAPRPLVPRRPRRSGRRCAPPARPCCARRSRSPRREPARPSTSDCEQAGKLAAVGGDVQAAVVVQVDRRERRLEGAIGGERLRRGRGRRAPIAGRCCTARARGGGSCRSAGGSPSRGPASVSSSALPSRRRRIGIASGLPLAARWSPSTPLSAATTASRSEDDGSCPRTGMSFASARSTPPPTSRVTPRMLRYTSPVIPFAGFCVALPSDARGAGDVVVHRLDDARDRERRVDGEAAQPAQVGGLDVAGLRDHGIHCCHRCAREQGERGKLGRRSRESARAGRAPLRLPRPHRPRHPRSFLLLGVDPRSLSAVHPAR